MYRDGYQGDQPKPYSYNQTPYYNPIESMQGPPPTMGGYYDMGMNMNMNTGNMPMDQNSIPSEDKYNPYFWQQTKNNPNPYDPYPKKYPPSSSSQPTIIQKISTLLKMNAPYLHKMMSRANPSSEHPQEKSKSRSYQRGRSRSQDHYQNKSRSRSRDKKQYRSKTEWSCGKCQFLNYQWRDKCKKCGQFKKLQRKRNQ